MLLIGAFYAMGQVQLQAGVAFTAVVDVPDRRHEPRLVGFGVQGGMKLPVQASPTGHVVIAAEFVHKGLQGLLPLAKNLPR